MHITFQQEPGCVWPFYTTFTGERTVAQAEQKITTTENIEATCKGSAAANVSKCSVLLLKTATNRYLESLFKAFT